MRNEHNAMDWPSDRWSAPRPLPRMILNPDVKSLFDFKYEDFQLEGYDPYPHIKAEVSV